MPNENLQQLSVMQLQFLCALLERECLCFCHKYPQESLHREGCSTACTSRIQLLEGVRGLCINRLLHISGELSDLCLICHGLGWTPTENVVTWWNSAVDSLNLIVSIKNDGPGWRANFYKNDYRELDSVAEGWSDGNFDLDSPPKWKPTQLEALLKALDTYLRPLAINAAEAEQWVRENVK